MVGIVASRLKESFDRPALVIALDDDGIGKGSGRSISGVDLGAAVLAAKDSGLLVAGGGHAMAAGVTVAPGGIEPLRAFLHERLAADDRRRARRPQPAARRPGSRPAGSPPACATRSTRAGPMAPAGPRRASPPARRACSSVSVVGNGHVRAIAAGDDGKSFKLIAFRAADTPLGQALLAAAPDQRFWLAGTIKRDE